MIRLTLLAILITLAPSPLVPVHAQPQPRTPRPSILFLYADDLARWAVRPYGYPEAPTPHLDRLARSAALFTHAFTATPVCSPSRASLMTGRFPTQLHIEDWINPTSEPHLGLDPAEITWPELLQQAGYRTALLGKWHLGTQDRFHPTHQGFHHFFGFRSGSNQPINPMLETDLGPPQQLQGSLPDLLIDEAIRFISADPNTPFLVSIHFRAPHTPYLPVPAADLAAVRDLHPAIPPFPGLPEDRVRQLTRDYYASVHSIDRNLGRLLDHLDQSGRAARTIIVFSSDHGYMIGHHGLWHKGNAAWLIPGRSGHRPNMFDHSLRVPLIIRWPGVTTPGSRISQVVSNLDLFPTMLAAAGLPIPTGLSISGRNFQPLLQGKAITWDNTLFGQYDMHHYQRDRMRMIRTPEAKLVRHLEAQQPDELYDLAQDPEELHNLIDEPDRQPLRHALQTRLDAWMRSIQDPLSNRKP